MCEYRSSNYGLPNWKCVFHCCAQCPRMDLSSPESDKTNQMLSSPYDFIPIKTSQIVLCIEYTLSIKRKSFNCVRILQIQLLLQKFIQEKSLSWWSNQLWNFTETYKFLQFINFHFAYHMYAFLEHITVETHAERHSSSVQISRCVVPSWLCRTCSSQLFTPNPIWILLW